MSTPGWIPTIRNSLAFGALVAALSSSGCAHLSNWCNTLLIKAQEKNELAHIRHDTRAVLALERQEALRIQAERDIEEARLVAEQQRLEREFCLARQEALQRQVKRGVREVIESKVALNVEHGLEVGELEVDVAALQQLLKEREQQPLQAPPPAPLQKHPCPCCDQPCGCQAALPRRHCPHCRHKPCEAELKCGGPEAFAQLKEFPARQPLRAAEIPLKLPVRLTLGLEQPTMEAARVRRVPLLPPEALQRPCDHGKCPFQCTEPLGDLPPRNESFEVNVLPPAPLPPPTPVPDTEVRHSPTPPMQLPAIRLGMAPLVPNSYGLHPQAGNTLSR
jgi:hypothetical protein